MNLLKGSNSHDKTTHDKTAHDKHENWFITIERAEGVEDKDRWSKSDTYVMIEFAGHHERTHTINNNRTPFWNETFNLKVDPDKIKDLNVKLMDDDFGKDDPLGLAIISREDLPFELGDERYLRVPVFRKEQTTGIIILRVRRMPDQNLSSSYVPLEQPQTYQPRHNVPLDQPQTYQPRHNVPLDQPQTYQSHDVPLDKPQTYHQSHDVTSDKPQTYYQSHDVTSDKPQTYHRSHDVTSDKPQTYQSHDVTLDKPQTYHQSHDIPLDKPQTYHQSHDIPLDQPQTYQPHNVSLDQSQTYQPHHNVPLGQPQTYQARHHDQVQTISTVTYTSQQYPSNTSQQSSVQSQQPHVGGSNIPIDDKRY
jgi:hypothetical protein